MLDELKKDFPPFFTFHLRELYLRKNLPLDASKGNYITFKALNDVALQDYLIFLMEHHLEPRIIALYLQALEEAQQTQMMKIIIQFC